MDRHAALIHNHRHPPRHWLGGAPRLALLASLLLLLASVAWAKPPAPAPKKKAPPSLHVRSIDLPRRYVLIELSGVKRTPAPNLFTFTDERNRHFVALNSACDPPFPSGTRACELQIPDGYQRHRLARLELHLGGLHSRTIAAPVGEISAAWAAATEMLKAPSPSPSPAKVASKPSPSPSPRLQR
jgi:hypothetical protein